MTTTVSVNVWIAQLFARLYIHGSLRHSTTHSESLSLRAVHKMRLRLRLITTNGLFWFQCCCCNRTVWTFTLNTIELIICDKNRNRTMWTSLNAQFLRVSFYYFDKTAASYASFTPTNESERKSDDSVLVIDLNCGFHFKWTNCQALSTCNVFSPLFDPLFFMQMLNNNSVNDQQNGWWTHSVCYSHLYHWHNAQQ